MHCKYVPVKIKINKLRMVNSNNNKLIIIRMERAGKIKMEEAMLQKEKNMRENNEKIYPLTE